MTTTEDIYNLYLQHPVISTDTRKIAAGSLFFALKGDKFDANAFARQAIEAGASYAVIDNPEYQSDERYLLVNDVLTALQNLARHHRQQLSIPVIGLTGSNGKTTTKELISAVLSQRFNTLATQGNLNNHIGVPLTILSINQSHQVAVIEMGANHQKEIELLCSIALPSQGLITNIGKAHLEGFGGVEGIKKGKGELYDYLKESEGKGVAFVNSDSSILMEMQQHRHLRNVVLYGSGEGSSVSGEIMESSPLVTLNWTNKRSNKNSTVKTQLTGAYNLDNMLAAICIGVYFEMPDEEINKGIETYQPKNNRSQIQKTVTNTLICDYYNANPSSMLVAIENISKISASRKVLILGDMFEMGDEAAAEHEAVIKNAMESPVDQCIFIGKEFALAGTAMANNLLNNKFAAEFYTTAEEAIQALTEKPIKDSTILIKGSRGMALERLVELF